MKAEKKDNEVIISVKDNGRGIDPQIIPRLFTKFATKSDTGTGLGLFISKSIVAGWTRVLRFCFPITSGQPSSIVVGKPDFVTPDVNVNGSPTAVPPSQSLLWAASDVCFDQSGNIWVSDEKDERILKYDAVKDQNFYPNLFHCGQPASFVLGQTDFNHRNLNQTQASESTLWAPQAIAFDVASDLWVADNQYNRVLRFSHPFSTLGQNATLVLGQSNFTSLNRPSPPTARSLNRPSGIAFDHSGNLWVADSGNNRILRYSRPFSSPPSAQPATKVLGKQNFTSLF